MFSVEHCGKSHSVVTDVQECYVTVVFQYLFCVDWKICLSSEGHRNSTSNSFKKKAVHNILLIIPNNRRMEKSTL